MPLTFGSLFAGIGGFDLGFERAGMKCLWQVEINEQAIEVLEKQWPGVRRHNDVRTWPTVDAERVDVLCGGFPCQDISFSNMRGQGLAGERSGLWFEYERIIRALRPRYVAIENVAALLVRGLDGVLGSLAGCGYDAEWQTLPASAFGAPHRRDRVLILAYDASQRRKKGEALTRSPSQTSREKQDLRLRHWPGRTESGRSRPDRIRWCPDGQLCRVADGVPDRVDRYRQLGNSIVPQKAEWLGRLIIEDAV
ncbi:MAG: DNA (cytosine-5-)-methyltransferase [Pirellulales bacterium]